MNAQAKVTADHLRKQAILYVRPSTLHQVKENRDSTALQYDLKRHAQELGWNGLALGAALRSRIEAAGPARAETNGHFLES